MGSCCSSLVPKYQSHLDALLPAPTARRDLETLGGVLEQEDVTQWKMRANPSDMTSYARQMPEKLAPMANYLYRKIKTEFQRGRLSYVAVSMQCMTAIVDACHADETLSLYEASVCSSMMLLFEDKNTELQILAAQCLCSLLKAQAPEGVAASQVYSSTDYAKFAPFYPYVLRMANRNPSVSALQQAKELFKDKPEHVAGSSKKRTKDLLELDMQPYLAGEERSSSNAEDRLKHTISIWRSRYFGLKALVHLLRFNRDANANFSRMHDILPALLVNFPKQRRALKAVVRDINAGATEKVDETFKPIHSDARTPSVAPAKQDQKAASVEEKQALVNNVAPKDELTSKTGIAMHEVQLQAYNGFLALCRMPNMALHVAELLHELFSWLDQSQATVVRTALNGATVGNPAPVDAPPASARKKSEPPASTDAPFAWEDLHLTSHLFNEILCHEIALEQAGGIDVVVLSLLQHMDDVELDRHATQPSRRTSRTGGREDSTDEDHTAVQRQRTSLAQDFKQLFRRRTSRLSVPRNGRVAQVAILQLLKNVLAHLRSSSSSADGVVTPESQQSIMNYQIVFGTFLTHLVHTVKANEFAVKVRAHASSVAAAAGSPSDDQTQLDMEAFIEQSAALGDEVLQLLTHDIPRVLTQRFYSFNDILQSITLVLHRGINQNASKGLKRALMDAAYSMSLGMLKWTSPDAKTIGYSDENMSSAVLYDSLVHAVLGAIVCETNAALRATGYEILQSILICMNGFGGSWTAVPSASMMMHASSFGSVAHPSLHRGFSEQAESAHNRSTTNLNGAEDNQVTRAPSLPLTLELPNEEKQERSTGSRTNNSSDPHASMFDPTPSPRLSQNESHIRSRLDIRERRIPQVFASALDVKSQLNSVTNASASQRANPSSLSSCGPVARLSSQDHKWIMSIIYYEITACLSASVDAPVVSSPDASKPPAEPTAFQTAAAIVKPRGRGVTTNENIILCFQILLLLLQKLPSSSSISEGNAASIQQVLALQFPLIFALQSYLTSSAAEDKFYLTIHPSLKLHTFITAYLFFVSKLLTLSVDNHWIRQQSVSLEELLMHVTAERAKNLEGLGSELEASWLQGLTESNNKDQVPTPIVTPIDPEQLSSILGRLLVERSNASLQTSSSSSAASAAAMDESVDSAIHTQKCYLLSPGSFEPFSLQFLLPEGGVRELGLERESSQSWAPSGKRIPGGDSEETRIGGDAYREQDDQGTVTPRQQSSPGHKPRGSLGPLSSPVGTGIFSLGVNSQAELETIAASPLPQQSASEIMAEIDQQNFQSLASVAAKNTVRHRSQFDQFMAGLEPFQPNGIEESKASGVDKSAADAGDAKDVVLENGSSPVVEHIADWHPSFDVMRPLSASTLDLRFPQLASYDEWMP